jgi:hypothetical protein
MILQIATGLAIGAYVVLSKDVQPKRSDASLASRFSAGRIISIVKGRSEVSAIRGYIRHPS